MSAPIADAPPARVSLAVRLVVLYAAATAALLVVLGTALASMLKVQLEERDLRELNGKTEEVEHLLSELGSAARIDREIARFAELGIGHENVQLGLRKGTRWLSKPATDIAALIDASGNDDIPHMPRFGRYTLTQNTWWLRRLDFVANDDITYVAYVAYRVTPTEDLLGLIGGTMAAAGLIGVLASAALGWWAARRGLAPLAAIGKAAERVTADRLGQPLRVDAAPEEVRGLVVSINRMLERLRESFRSLEDFSADLAHELRTPLNNLLLMTQVTLSRPRGAEEYREALHSNLAELERLQRMVSDMLFLARADKGILELKLEQVDLVQEATSAAEFFEAAAAEKEQRIDIQGSADAACDRAMARRAITNLLSNAVRYAPRDSVIKLRLRNGTDDAQVIVENSAAAHSPEELQRLFARFARGTERTAATSTSDGAGLGLSIVDSIMRLHGGSVTADSGTYGLRITLTFPLRQGATQ